MTEETRTAMLRILAKHPEGLTIDQLAGYVRPPLTPFGVVQSLKRRGLARYEQHERTNKRLTAGRWILTDKGIGELAEAEQGVDGGR